VYLRTLKHETLGFTSVTSVAMLTHLMTTYGVIAPAQARANRQKLDADWNPDDPIETLWGRVTDCLRFATAANVPIAEGHAVDATLDVIERTGVFSDAIRDWRKRPMDEWDLDNLTTDFTTANEERIRALTAGTAGYHGANAATDTQQKAPPSTKTNTTPATSESNAGTQQHIITNGTHMYYCHTHGLGTNRSHTSITCNKKGEHHKDEATATNMMGGNRMIMMSGHPTNNKAK
jgi:hypothetical protein